MIMLKRGAGDPARIEHAVAILRPSTLDDISAALAEYARSGGTAAHVESVGERCRWSPATEGGPYALLRILARFLRCDHTELTIGCRSVDDQWCVVGDPDSARSDTYLILDLPWDVDQLLATFG
jgi:hypothetical protein